MKKLITCALIVLFFGLVIQASGCKKKVPVADVNTTRTAEERDNQIAQDEINARQEYYSSVMGQKMILSGAFFELDTLIKNPKPKDSSWSFQVDALLVKIQKVLENKYGKTCPVIYNDANIEYTKALDAFQYFVKNYPQAVENMNSELLSTCSEKLKLGYQSIEVAGKTLEEKKP